MFFWRWLLLPFTILYNLITRFRNYLYNVGVRPSFSFEVDLIGIGNLEMGGTGKTMLANWLIEQMLESGQQPAYLSRGFLRKSNGFVLATTASTPDQVGDEAYMIYQKYQGKVPVAVGENRALAIPELLYKHGETTVILLDDVFQHRAVKPSVSILLTHYDHPFYEDFVVPVGRLREDRKGAERASVIIVTKCPESISEEEQKNIREAIKHFNTCQVYFSSLVFQTPINGLGQLLDPSRKIVAISGIAHEENFTSHLKTNYQLTVQLCYHDHVQYTESRLREILVNMKYHEAVLVCTEKDFVKLNHLNVFKPNELFYLPVRMKFLKDEAGFKQLIQGYLKNNFIQRIDD